MICILLAKTNALDLPNRICKKFRGLERGGGSKLVADFHHGRPILARDFYSRAAMPRAFIFRYRWLRSSPSNSAARVTLPFASSSFFKM